MLTSLVNVAYVLMLVAFVTRDILHLRALLVAAQIVIVIYTWSSGIFLIAGWNVVFAAINLTMVVLILRERRGVVLPAALRGLYRRHFSPLTPREFQTLWGLGRAEVVEGAPLTRTGVHPDALYFVRHGQVRVRRAGGLTVDLSPGYFIGEMSLLTGNPANATVDPIGRVEVQRWDRATLADLRERQPALWTRIQSVIGLDLIAKIQLGEERARLAASPARLDEWR